MIHLNHCGVSPLNTKALEKMKTFLEDHALLGGRVFEKHGNPVENLRHEVARLLETSRENVSFTVNTATAMNMIANGYNFHPDDEILSFQDEYPANHYPWKLQEQRGVKLTEVRPSSGTGIFSTDDLLKNITNRTRIIAVSHVQFTSGFAADIQTIGNVCREKGIDLVIDAAQSLGALPLYPENQNIAAVAASGWKWLMGPVGSGVLYTSPEFRKKIKITMAGSDLMIQGQDYLNHAWQPHTDGRMFEYATLPAANAAGLAASVSELNRTGIENIYSLILERQRVFREILEKHYDPDDPDSSVQYALRPEERENTSGILSLKFINYNPSLIVKKLSENKVIVSSRGPYLRIAPHYYNTADEVKEAAECLIRILKQNEKH